MKTQEDLLNEMVGRHPNATPKSMPITKIEAFEKQFGWIRDFIKGQISQVYVQGLEPKLVGRRLSWITKVKLVDMFSDEEYDVDEQIFFLDKKFKLVNAQRIEAQQVKKYRFFGPRVPRQRIIHFDGTTTLSIRSALRELGDEGRRVRILLSYCEYTQAAIIFKIPGGNNLKDWFDGEIETERAGFEEAFGAI